MANSKLKTAREKSGMLRAITNADYAKLVADVAPEFNSVAAQMVSGRLTEESYTSMQRIPGGETKFYNIALLVGMQRVDFVNADSVLDRIGIIERFQLTMGQYMQRNRVGRIRNVNPAWLGQDGTGLKNGDFVNQDKVRKAEIKQKYWGISNLDYQNWFTIQRFDLKGGLLREGGIGEIVAAMYDQVSLDYMDFEYTAFFRTLNGVIHNTVYPLRDTQQYKLDSWTDGAPTDDEINAFIAAVKDICELIDSVPYNETFNAAGVMNSSKTDRHVLAMRTGMKSRIEKVLGYAFNDQLLNFPIKVVTVPNFGGLLALDENADPMVEVYDDDGAFVGYKVNGADDSTAIPKSEVPAWEDPNADVIAAIVEEGTIFMLEKNQMMVGVHENWRAPMENVFFNKPDNGIYYNDERNIITFNKPSA